MFMKTKQNVGAQGEHLALHFLLSLGYSLLERNYRYLRGEIDLIVQKENTMVVVEVKARKVGTMLSPQKAVTRTKQKHLIRTANAYLQRNQLDVDTRFDVISIIGFGENVQIEHLENAFYPLLGK
jgi:putative endonuclease